MPVLKKRSAFVSTSLLASQNAQPDDYDYRSYHLSIECFFRSTGDSFPIFFLLLEY